MTLKTGLLQEPQPSDSSAQARAERVSHVRKMAGLSFIQLSKKYKVGYSTIRQWEGQGNRQLSSKGAQILVELLKQEGIQCDTGWLLHGLGNPPFYLNNPNDSLNNPSLLEQEIAQFKNHYQNTVILKIDDDAMLPFIIPGDYVGGICLNRDHFELMDAQYCIVESKSHGLFCRWAQKVSHCDWFNFLCVNLSTKLKNPVSINSDKIIKVAPVIRVWKQNRLT
jgi:DNA-binding transcriptional regulator YiaG